MTQNIQHYNRTNDIQYESEVWGLQEFRQNNNVLILIQKLSQTSDPNCRKAL